MKSTSNKRGTSAKTKKAVKNAASSTKKNAIRTKEMATSKAKSVQKSGIKGTLRGLFENRKINNDRRKRKKAAYLATLPKSRVKRTLYRLNPKRVAKYWFSKEGAIMAAKITGVGFAAFLVLGLGLFAYFRRDLPDPRQARLLEQSTKFYDRTGEVLLFELYGNENRTIVEFDQISDAAKNATVAVEDKDFYEHGGVSFRGIARAAWSNFRSGDTTGQGGSTLTQQYIKNSLLTTDQTYSRKIQEIILALEMERLYSKDEILSFYLNQIPYGPQEYGIQAAAKAYFDKDAADLNISESAMLAALPQAPTYFSPYGENTEELIERQQVIIDLMAEQGYISGEQAEKAKKVDILKKVTPLAERSLYSDIIAPHFVLEVQKQLENDEDISASILQSGGLKVITTLDADLQKIAEESIKEADGGDGFCDTGGRCGDNAALVATDVDTGQILAMVGSRDFDYPEYGSFNAALADRQPGSSFKPYDYAQLFYSERWGPDSFIYDTPTTWGSYQPKNFDFGYQGQMTVREALGESRNIPAVKAIDIARPENVVGLAIDMGNKSLADDATAPFYDLSYGLGAGEIKLAEHTHAYGTFARGGEFIEQSYILSVENAEGAVIKEWEEKNKEQVLDEEVAYLITDALKDDAARAGTFGLGNGNLVVPGLNHTVKTGSTDASVDGLMMGYSANIATGVWVGNHDNAPMDSLTSQQTGPIFTKFMREAHEKKKLDFQEIIQERPEGIKEVRMDRNTGYAASDDSKETYVGLFASWYVPERSDEKTKYVIDTVSNKRATDCTPERAREERTGGGLWPEVPPDDYRFPSWSRTAGYGGSGGGTTEEDDVHKCSDKLPGVSLSVTEIGGGIYEFEATVSKGTFNLETLNFKVGNQIVNSSKISNNGGTVTYNHRFDSDGNAKVTAEAIDEGLYDNSASKNVNVSGSSASFSITSPSDGQSDVDTNATFTWESFPGANKYTFYYRKQGESYTSINVNSGNTSFQPGNLENEETYEVKIEALSGNTLLAESSVITIETED